MYINMALHVYLLYLKLYTTMHGGREWMGGDEADVEQYEDAR